MESKRWYSRGRNGRLNNIIIMINIQQLIMFLQSQISQQQLIVIS